MTRGRTLAWLALLLGAVALVVWQLRNPTVAKVHEDDQLGALVVTAPYAQWAAVELLHRGERVRFERDERIAAIVGGWARGATAERAARLGLLPHERFSDIIEQYIAD